jgi:hypothetical protein
MKKIVKPILLLGVLALGASTAVSAGMQNVQATNATSTATITFGTSLTSNATTLSKSAIQTSGISLASISASRVYGTYGYAARFGSSSYAGSLKLTFSNTVIISAVSVYAQVYGYDYDCGLKVATSAHTAYSTQYVTSSSFVAYTFSNLDNNDGDASSTLTLANASAGDRFYVSKVVVTFGSASTPVPSDPEPSDPVTPSEPSTSEGSTTSQAEVNGAYRIAPVTSSSSSVNVYNISYQSGLYRGTVVKTLTKSSIYTDPGDVSLYYQAFKALPKNYVHYTSSTLSSAKSSAYRLYGRSARLYTEYSRTDGYTRYFPTLNTYRYTEADIAVDSTYASSSSWNRGVGRLVIVPGGAKVYGSAPVIFKTVDHYAHFAEFYNYYNGFGSLFNGQNGTGYGSWVQPTTITYTI